MLAQKDIIAFGKLFLPDDFLRSETPAFHYEVADAINDPKHRQLAIILPRGHGKTVLTKCSLLHDFCFTKEPLFYGWVSATAKLATGNMDYIKYHLEFNERIQYYFGSLKGNKWTESDIELTNGSKLISKSNISGIRGGAKLHKRYDLIILDDFEDENNTITPEAEAKIPILSLLWYSLLLSPILVSYGLMVLLSILIALLIICWSIMIELKRIVIKILVGK